MTNTKSAATAIDLNAALKALRGKRGISAAALQSKAGWARKPSAYDLTRLATRKEMTLEVLDNGNYRFV